jgi:hypothetical protein
LLPDFTERNAISQSLIQEDVMAVIGQPTVHLGGQHVVFTGVAHKYIGH